jgi:hypothetical protein
VKPEAVNRSWMSLMGALVAGAWLSALCVVTIDCRSEQAKEASAEAAYTLELTRCVDKANTLAESKACRRRVNEQWGIVETVRDAGREQ